MEEMPRSKWSRVQAFDPNVVISTSFSLKYMCYLIPALLRATSDISYCGNKDDGIEKKVRFEVEMALVLSAGDFRWSRALKLELEEHKNRSKIYRSTTMDVTQFSIAENFDQIRTFNAVPRPLVPRDASRPKGARGKWSSRKSFRGKDELGFRVRTLRRILPGGSEMGVCELLSEVESYVVCLQMQVKILRSLVASTLKSS